MVTPFPQPVLTLAAKLPAVQKQFATFALKNTANSMLTTTLAVPKSAMQLKATAVTRVTPVIHIVSDAISKSMKVKLSPQQVTTLVVKQPVLQRQFVMFAVKNMDLSMQIITKTPNFVTTMQATVVLQDIQVIPTVLIVAEWLKRVK